MRHATLLAPLAIACFFTLPHGGAMPGTEGRRVDSRSGAGYETRSLGPVADQPGRERFQLVVGGESAGQAGAPALDGTLSLLLPSGDELGWRPALPPGTALAERTPTDEPGKSREAAWSRAAGGFMTRIPATSGGWGGRLTLPAGFQLDPSPLRGGRPEVRILDRRGMPAGWVRFVDAPALPLVTPVSAGVFDLRVSAGDRVSAAPEVITVVVSGFGAWGGWQCITLADQSTGTANQANPSNSLSVGELPHGVNPVHTCASYARWDVGGLLPPQAVVTAASLSANVNSFTGSPQTLQAVDTAVSLPYIGACPDDITCYQNNKVFNYYNDFTTMTGGRPVYGSVPVTGTGNFPMTLGASAIADLQAVVRGASPAFGIGYFTAPIGEGNYFTLSSASQLTITYDAPVNPAIVINRVRMDNVAGGTRAQFDLYNYGETTDLSGWKIRVINYASAVQEFTLPGGTALNRHERGSLVDAMGTAPTGSLYTNSASPTFALHNPSGTQSGQVMLIQPGGAAGDYLCWNAIPFTVPAGASWVGGCIAPALVTAAGDLRRVSDSDTHQAADWSNSVVNGTPDLLTGQYGTRRPSDVAITQVLVQAGFNWVELTNYGPDIDMAGWSLAFFDWSASGNPTAYTLPAGVILRGQSVWLAEQGGTFYPGSPYGDADTLHRNMGIDLTWDVPATKGGEILLREPGLAVRDYFAFGGSGQPHKPAHLNWYGANAGPVTLPATELARESDLTLGAPVRWVARTAPQIPTWGALNANQQGTPRQQDESGGNGQGFTNPGDGSGAVGNGVVVQVTRQAAVEEFALEANPAAAPRSGTLVIKKQGSGSLFFSRAVNLTSAGIQVVSSGRINPPLVLDPGQYAFMLYLDGAWADNERYSSIERLSFGTVSGTTTEAGATATTAFSVNFPFYAPHAWFSIVDPPVVTSATPLTGGEQTVAYAFSHTAAYGAGGPYSWTMGTGSLPAGLSLAANGAVSGTPTASGTYFFSVQVTDAIGLRTLRPETLTVVKAPSIATTAVNNASTLSFFSANFAVSDGTGPYSWSVSAGALPPGLTLNASSGQLSGTPTLAGAYSYTVRVQDSRGAAATAPFTQSVFSVSVLTANCVIVGGEVGVATAGGCTAFGGTPPYNWTILSGALAPGLTLNSATGQVTGTPTSVYINSVVIMRVTDQSGQQLTTQSTIAPVLRISIAERLNLDGSPPPPYNSALTPYSYPIKFVGGSGGYIWNCTFPVAFSGGMSCAGGMLSGTLPLSVVDGVYPILVQVTDSRGVSSSKTLQLTVLRSPQILTTTLAGGVIGVDYGQQRIDSAGGYGPLNWVISSGSLPPGLALGQGNGIITGTPTATGPFSFTVTYENSGGRASRAFSITIGDPVLPPYWVRRGLAGGSLLAYFSPNYAQDRYVFGRQGNQIFHSFDGGLYWQQITVPPPPANIGAFQAQDQLRTPVLAPGFDARPVGTPGRAANANHTIVTLRLYSGVWYSDDLGGTWTQLNTGLGSNLGAPYVTASMFMFDPDYPSNHRVYIRAYDSAVRAFRLFSGVINTVAKTISWTPLSASGTPLSTITMSPTFATDQTMMTYQVFGNGGQSQSSILRTTNGGASWQAVGIVPCVQSWFGGFSPNYAADGTYAVGCAAGLSNDGLYITTDYGVTFTRRLAGHPIINISFPPTYNAATNPVIYVSEYSDPNGGAPQLLKTTDNGATFLRVGSAGLNQFAGYFSVSPDFANDATLIGNGNSLPGLFRSTDGGTTWSPADGGLSNRPVVDIAYAPGDRDTLFLGTDSAIYSSTNGGEAWRRAILPFSGTVGAVKPSPNFALDRKVFAWACRSGSSTGCSVLRSTDGGISFDLMSDTGRTINQSTDFVVSPNFAADHALYFTAYDNINGDGDGLFASTNEGASFAQVGALPFMRVGFSPSFGTDRTLAGAAVDYVTPYGPQFLRSTDGGANFSNFTLPTVNEGAYPVFHPDYDRLNGAPGTGGLSWYWNCWKTDNDGQTWTQFPATGDGCSSNDYFSRLALTSSFSTDNTMYSYVQATYPAVGQTGLFKSSNGGNTFSQLSVPGDPYAFAFVTAIAPSPAHATDSTVFVATQAGLYKSTNGGANWAKSTGTEAFAPDVTSVALDLNRQGVVYIGTLSGKVFYSQDDGNSADEVTSNLLGGKVQAMVTTGTPLTRLVVGTPAGIYHRTDFTANGFWTLAATGDFRTFTRDSSTLYAARADGASLTSTDGGVTWTALAPSLSDAQVIVRVPGTGSLAESPAGSNAGLWAASATTGALWSANNGGAWAPAPGGNDYALPALAGAARWTTVQPLGLNAQSGGREVLVGNNGDPSIPAALRGVFLSRDGGDYWRNVSGAGSGLEATSKIVSAFLTAQTPYGSTDVLVGLSGSTTGGVYLSGDGGEHWTQVNQGFDPNSLSISTLVKSSCAGCPVQYYSGSFGGGMYTRTIAVVAPPSVTGWYFGDTVSPCGAAAGSGPATGGQSFKLCGTGFQAGAVVEFDGVPASGCTASGGTLITCAATPAHFAGGAVVRVRNPDTRVHQPAISYSFTGASRPGNSLRVAKSSGNAWISWTCAACSGSAPARVWRGQNAALTSFLEQYNGGANGATTGGCSAAPGNNSCYNNGGALASAQSYFWSVE